jgi:ferritin-like metal-binding protein YciE
LFSRISDKPATSHRSDRSSQLGQNNQQQCLNPAAKELNMKIESLRDLFEIELRYAYDCEQKLAKKGLPLMIESSTSTELRNALEQHLKQTRNHITRLERVFSVAQYDAKTEDNDVLDQLTSSVKDTVGDIDESYLRDAALIVGGNKVEHYEMALYGSLVAFARQLGYSDAAVLLQQTLDEEKEADAKLTQIAETAINRQASTEPRAA